MPIHADHIRHELAWHGALVPLMKERNYDHIGNMRSGI